MWPKRRESCSAIPDGYKAPAEEWMTNVLSVIRKVKAEIQRFSDGRDLVSGARLFGVRRLWRRFGSPSASQALARPRPLRKVPVSWKRTNESRNYQSDAEAVALPGRSHAFANRCKSSGAVVTVVIARLCGSVRSLNGACPPGSEDVPGEGAVNRKPHPPISARLADTARWGRLAPGAGGCGCGLPKGWDAIRRRNLCSTPVAVRR
jgi:hypothetical protein